MKLTMVRYKLFHDGCCTVVKFARDNGEYRTVLKFVGGSCLQHNNQLCVIYIRRQIP
jgi:hypothetical protein